jgi:hypothetical protein
VSLEKLSRSGWPRQNPSVCFFSLSPRIALEYGKFSPADHSREPAPVVRDAIPKATNESSGETQNTNRWSQLIHRLRPYRWLAETASRRHSHSMSTISESPPSSAHPKSTKPGVRHLQKVAEWVVERSSQLGRSPPPRSSPSSPHMTPRAHVRPRPLTHTLARNPSQTETRVRSLAHCTCHGDREAFGAETAPAAYTCYPYNEYVDDSTVHALYPQGDYPGEVGQQTIASAYTPYRSDIYPGGQRALEQHGHYG